jgi:hypothetical protein
VAQQGINNALTVGQYQQAAPFTNVSNYGKVIGGVQAPTTVSNQTQVSPLNQIMGIANLAPSVLNSLFGKAASGTTKAVPGLISGEGFAKWLNSLKLGGSGLSPDQLPGGSNFSYGSDSSTQDALNSGMTPVDEDGNPMPGWGQNSSGSWTYDTSNITDTSGNSGGAGDTGTEQDLYDAESSVSGVTDEAANDYQDYYDNP